MEAIRTVRPPRLYVAADGARERKGEAERCRTVRHIATDVDWQCEVKTLFQNRNLGCRVAVSTAIDWFFQLENEGIILEDDCLPGADFFPFCAQLLERFRDDEKIMAVCGSSYAEPPTNYKASYYFSYYADMWGWATWRRAWRLYDRDLSRWPEFKACGGLKALTGPSPWREPYWTNIFDASRRNLFDSWGYRWIYSVIEHGGIACYPVQNLISNLGFRGDATHTIVNEHQPQSPRANLSLGKLEFPLVHPTVVARSEALERQIDAKRLDLISPSRIRRQIWVNRLHRLFTSPRSLLRNICRRLASWNPIADIVQHGEELLLRRPKPMPKPGKPFRWRRAKAGRLFTLRPPALRSRSGPGRD